MFGHQIVNLLGRFSQLLNALGAFDVVDSMQQSQCGRFDHISRQPHAVEDASVIINRDVDLTESVHAGTIGGDFKARELAAHARQTRDAVIDRIHRTVADARVRTGTLADLQSHRGRCRHVAAAAHHVEAIEAIGIVVVFALLGEEHQGLKVIVKHLSLLIGKLQESGVDVVELVVFLHVAEILQAGTDHMAAGTRRHAHIVALKAHALRR